MYNPILEKRKELIDNIQKSFDFTENSIEKAKWQIGEVRVDSRGIAHECYEYTADGKPRLRRVKKNKDASTTSADDKKKQISQKNDTLGKKDSIDNKKQDLDNVGEFKNGFKFKNNTDYTLRYNKWEKKYEVFENKIYRGAGKIPMWELKSDGDNNIGDEVLKMLRKRFPRSGSTISFEGNTFSLKIN